MTCEVFCKIWHREIRGIGVTLQDGKFSFYKNIFFCDEFLALKNVFFWNAKKYNLPVPSMPYSYEMKIK